MHAVTEAQPAERSAAAESNSTVASTAAPRTETITTTVTRAEGQERRIVAWITAAVLAVLLLVSVGTVRSILAQPASVVRLNDSMGHAFGDQVLTGIAQRLKEPPRR